MNKQLIKKIGSSAPKQIEELLLPICKQAGIKDGKKFLSIYLSIGGLHYTIEKIASEMCLNPGKIDEETRATLQIINLGCETQILFSDLFRANELFAEEKKTSWNYESKKNELDKCHDEFVEAALKLCFDKMKINNKTVEKKKRKTATKKQIDAYGKQLVSWLYSDPDYAYRLDHEGSGNW